MIITYVPGREQDGSQEVVHAKMEQLVRTVRDRGLFKTRRPEGKAGDH
jgi:hypothetical protein